jgi:hypothetical protein
MERARKDGSVEAALDREHVARSELRINTRKWLLSKMLPKKFGDRIEHEHKGQVVITLGKDDKNI